MYTFIVFIFNTNPMIFPHHQKVLALYTLKDHLNTIQRLPTTLWIGYFAPWSASYGAQVLKWVLANTFYEAWAAAIVLNSSDGCKYQHLIQRWGRMNNSADHNWAGLSGWGLIKLNYYCRNFYGPWEVKLRGQRWAVPHFNRIKIIQHEQLNTSIIKMFRMLV